MKQIVRLISVLLVIATVISFVPVSAFADDVTFKMITDGKYFKPESAISSSSPKIAYKYKVLRESLIKVNCKTTAAGAMILFSSKKDLSDVVAYVRSSSDDGKSVQYITLPKGTYYVAFQLDDTYSGKFKFTATPQSDINKQNYNRAKAINLKTKNWVTIAQTPNYNYARWYRVTLTKKQVIHVSTNEDAARYITIYDSKFNQPDVASGSKTVFTENKLPKGTYYIKVDAIDDWRYGTSDYASHSYIHMKWY